MSTKRCSRQHPFFGGLNAFAMTCHIKSLCVFVDVDAVIVVVIVGKEEVRCLLSFDEAKVVAQRLFVIDFDVWNT